MSLGSLKFSFVRNSGFLLITVFGSSVALGANGDPYSPSFFVDVDGGYTTYKSSLVANNDTSTAIHYGLGAYAGANHTLGMRIDRSSSSVSFALNSSKLVETWQDVQLLYRFGVVSLGAVITSSSWVVSSPPLDSNNKPAADGTPVSLIDVVSSGYGVSTGLSLPITNRSALESSVLYTLAAPGRAKAAAANADAATVTASQRTTVVGPRMETQIGGRIGLTRNMIDAICGFRYTTFSLTVDNVAHHETMITTYVGLAANWNF